MANKPAKARNKRKATSKPDTAGSNASAKKRKATSKQDATKRATRARDGPPAVINDVPKDILTVMAFGNGDCGELGLGARVTEAPVPKLNPYLDPDDATKLHVVQLSCGGQHTAALTADNQIVTWGSNDNGALGRDSTWEGDMRDIDAGSDSDDDDEGDLNPYESTPTPIPGEHFPPGTTFAQVAAGDSCTFVLTDTGLVYGWGTFRVSCGQFYAKQAAKV